MEHVVNCIKCDKTFYTGKDLTNHLSAHAKMDFQGKEVEVEKSLQSMRTTKMQVKIENMKLPIERTKRKREGSGESGQKRIKIQDGANEISVNCQVDQPCCKICKPKRNFKNAEAYHYHMVMTHDGVSDSIASTPVNGLIDLPKECLTPNKSKLRVKSQAGTVEIVDMVEESPNKTVIDQSVAVMNKLKSLTCTSVSVSDLPSRNKSEQLDTEEVSVKSSKFSKTLEQVRRATKKGSNESTNGVTGVAKLGQSQGNCVKLKFKEYVTADSESDFEVTEKEAVEKRTNLKKTDEMYQQVSAVIDKVLIQNSIQLSPTSSLKKTPTISSVKPASIKLIASHTNGFSSPVKCTEVVDMLEQGSNVNSCDMVLDESPRSKSGRLLVKSKRLISTESADRPIIDNKDSDVANFPKKLSKESPVVQNGFCDQKLKKELSSSSSKSKVKSDSDSYNPETQSSDSATANSDAEFAQPLRKSNRVKGPKPPQIRDPIENPAPKAKRRLSERKFEGAKPFKCNHCPLDFSNIESKKIHEQTHEEKPIQCVYCDMRFAIEFSLKKHTRIHKT